jgi:hypothetical protein
MMRAVSGEEGEMAKLGRYLVGIGLAGLLGVAQAGEPCVDCDSDGHLWPTDCNDSTPLTHPTATESCDGYDNDCIPRRVTAQTLGAREPSLVWAGTEYGVAWTDGQDIFFARLDASGQRLAPPTKVTSTLLPAGHVSLVWTGAEYALAWEDCRDDDWEIYFARLDALGRKIGSDLRVTSHSHQSFFPSLVWTGHGYGIAWSDLREAPGGGGHFEIYFGLLDAEGNRLGDDVRVTHAHGSSFEPSLTWSGQEFGLAWYDRRDDPYLLTGRLYFVALDTFGQKIGFENPVTSDLAHSEGPHLVWTGGEYGLTWYGLDLLGGGNWEIHFARLNVAGITLGDSVHVSLQHGASWQPAIVWNGTGYGIAWDNERQGHREVYFSNLVCDCEVDLDGDGFSVCTDCNDHDALARPDAPEIPGNRIDENCDGELACDPDLGWAQHGQFVRCVTHAIKALERSGEITQAQAQGMIRAAARSDMGRSASRKRDPQRPRR